MSFTELRDRFLAALLRRGKPAEVWTRLLAQDESALRSREQVRELVQVYLEHPDPRAEPVLRKLAGLGTLDVKTRCMAAGAMGRRADQLARDDPASAEQLAAIAADAFEAVIADLSVAQRADRELAGWVWSTLARCCAGAGASHHDRAIAAWQEALRVEANPDWEFNLGLIYKRSARFGEGLAIFQRHVAAGRGGQEYLWNVGICATGAGWGPVALRAWKDLGMKATLGDDGLPCVAGLGLAKVRLSRPAVGDEPETAEHLFLKRVSPCHGELLNPTRDDLGADIGDLVLHDGDPIGHWHDESGGHGHRFEALGLVRRGAWKTFRFRARGLDARATGAISSALPGESGLYDFGARIAELGGRSARPRVADGGSAGKLLVAPRLPLEDVRAALERALAAHPDITIAVPALYDALGDVDAAARHRHTWRELGN